MRCKGELGTYSSTASGILCGASSDEDYLMFRDDLVVAFHEIERGEDSYERHARLDK
jgi:hypothetical protein